MALLEQPEARGLLVADSRVHRRWIVQAYVAGAEPALGRTLDRLPLDEPPYSVVEAIPAITFPFYGIRIDSSARVLDEGGAPIPGLFAAGSDTGGLFVRAYAGGIASALVFGLAAARTAVGAPVA